MNKKCWYFFWFILTILLTAKLSWPYSEPCCDLYNRNEGARAWYACITDNCSEQFCGEGNECEIDHCEGGLMCADGSARFCIGHEYCGNTAVQNNRKM
jgi:hypothetical protein